MDPLIWPLILLLLAIALIFLEIFIPSGGVLTVMAAAALVASIIVGFSRGFMAGTMILFIDVVIIPIVVGVAIKWWPHTPFGRMVMIKRPSGEDQVLPNTKAFRLRQTVLGKRGVAITCLLPSGDVRIDGQVYDSVSDGMAIEAGQAVVVVDVRTQRVVVRPLGQDELSEKLPAESQDDGGSTDILSTPIESLGIEPFDDPLA